MINIQHVTLNDTTQLAKLCMSIGAQIGPARRYDLMHCNRLCLQQGENQLLYLKEFIIGQKY